MAEPSPDAILSVPCHLSGVTRLCFSLDGTTIFTGGSDCLVRIHEADNPESEPGFHDEHTEAVTCLACSKDELVTGCVDNIVRQFSYPENKFTGFVTRSSGVPIRWLSVDKDGERVAVCSDDMVVKIVNLKDTSKVSLVSDNNKPVRSATWDPTGKYLTTTSCDGKLKVYDTSGSTPYCVKVFEGVIAATDSDSDTSCYAQWHPSGNYFAVPTRTNDIAVFGRDGWGRQSSYTPDGPKALIGELAWSPNGKYLAVAAATNLYIFSSETRQPIGSYTCPDGAISGLQFSPNANLLGFTSLDGSFHRWKEPIPSEFPDPYTSEAAQAKKLDRLLDDEFPDDDDIEERGEDIGDEDIFGDDNWIVDDDGNLGGYGGYDDEKKWGKGRTEVVNVTKAQAPFTPGSTSFRNKKRYLAFNMIGVIDVTDQETHNVVNVEFHDKSTRRGYHFQDHNKFTLASLGEQGIVYACPAEGDQPSLVYYRPYNSWTSQSDWTLNLLPKENVMCVTAGGPANPETGMGSVVVATSKGWVRFLSASGIQKYMWRLGEEVVSMAAGVDRVLIAHREGGTSLDGCQNLRYTLLDLESYDIVQEGKIPLPKKTTLTWLGFTSDGAPAMFDTSGLLSILDRHRRPNQARWVPLLDTASLVRDGKKEGYWPVGVSATHLSCVLLKGLETEPSFPRPLIQEVELHMPMLNMDNQQGKLEESYVRGSVNLSNLTDSSDPDASYLLKETELAMDKEMLQLVQGACKADNLQRALDVARLMHHSATIEAAAKVAAFYHLPGLQERIQSVKGEKEKEKREKRREATRGPERSYRYSSPPPEKAVSREFMDFAPRATNRRSFAGAGAGVNRDSTPAASGPPSTFIPETPGLEVDATPAPGFDEDTTLSDMKRKRDKEIDDFARSKKRGSDFSFDKPASAAKNPFASRKSNVPASNPFAKGSNGGKPLDAIKSTSFFDRVDDLESNGAPKPKKTKAKKEKITEGATSGAGGKQTTLFGAGITKKTSSNKSLNETTIEWESDRDTETLVPETLMEEMQETPAVEEDETQDDETQVGETQD
ncbi:chromosome transmission fidelity protein 4 [Cryptococcus neoformans Tu401-1]|nr:chromosome transmission fidelity protein 4 [Cryptococcus neoformans var. grubii Bt85]OXG12771.1 chromosome transmission fidelity protein 4 [Cryptococcus neoformans var. grubii Tu401-1]